MHTNPTSVVTFLECKWCCQNAALSLFVNIILQEGRLCNSLTFDALFPPFVQIFSLLPGKFQGRVWQGIYYFDFSDSWAQQTFGASERLCCCVGGGFTKLFRFIKWVNSVKSFKSWRSIVSPSSVILDSVLWNRAEFDPYIVRSINFVTRIGIFVVMTARKFPIVAPYHVNMRRIFEEI